VRYRKAVKARRRFSTLLLALLRALIISHVRSKDLNDTLLSKMNVASFASQNSKPTLSKQVCFAKL